MFFSTELLSKRDSGFGLLWLAATLGSRSTFKKLPKRSIMTADISALCDLITQPDEPLALRLSSNLMVGVARVYKAKHEIFLSDVTNCFTNLKKAVNDLHKAGLESGSLEMAQTSVRPETITITNEPGMALALDFDYLHVMWTDYVPGRLPTPLASTADNTMEADPSIDLQIASMLPDADGNFPSSSAVGGGFASPPPMERSKYTLDEFHLHSFEHGVEGDRDAFGFGEEGGILFEGLGDGEIDLGIADAFEEMIHGDVLQDAQDFGMYFQYDDTGAGGIYTEGPRADGAPLNQRDKKDAEKPKFPSSDSPRPSPEGTLVASSPTPKIQKKRKHAILFDARTELTNEELYAWRDGYEEEQKMLRAEMERKKREKNAVGRVHELLWGCPTGFEAPELIDLWQHNFKSLVDARSGSDNLDKEFLSPEPPPKRRKTKTGYEPDFSSADRGRGAQKPLDDRVGIGGWDDGGGNWGVDYGMDAAPAVFDDPFAMDQDVEQARKAHGSSQQINGSQRSSFLPWTNAGMVSSSIVGGDFASRKGSSDKGRGISVEPIDIRKGNSNSRSRRQSSIIAPSPLKSGSLHFPDGSFGAIGGDGLELDFNVEDAIPEPPTGTQQESQLSEFNASQLERNSFNFLEYTKQQLDAVPGFPKPKTLGFNAIVTLETSDRRVAAAAFYHCLVLATKDLIRVRQEEPYQEVVIEIL